MWRKQEPPHLAHLIKGWCRSQFCLFQAAMLESEHIASLNKSWLLCGREKDGNRKFLQLAFLSLCYCVLIILDGERRRLRVWGLREQEEDGAVRVAGRLSLYWWSWLVYCVYSFPSGEEYWPWGFLILSLLLLPPSLQGHHPAPHLCLWSLTSLYELPVSLLGRMSHRGTLLWPSVPEVWVCHGKGANRAVPLQRQDLFLILILYIIDCIYA